MSSYKIGQTLVSADNIGIFREGKIVARHENGNWIIEVTVPDDRVGSLPLGRLVSRSEPTLDDYYRVKPEFFQVDRTYRFTDGTSLFRYEVTELFLNENPVADQKKLQALAVAHKDGRSHRRLLDESDFGYMEEVK